MDLPTRANPDDYLLPPDEVMAWLTDMWRGNPPAWFLGHPLASFAGCDPADRSQPGRSRVLAAGASLLLEGGRENLLAILSSQRLARRASASRQTVHDNFRDADLVAELASYATDIDRSRREAQLFVLATEWFIAQPLDLPDQGMMRQLALVSFEAARHDPVLGLQLLLNAAAPTEPTVAAGLRAMRNEHHAIVTPAWRRVLDHLGWQIQPPHSVESFVHAVSALRDGFALHTYVDETLTAHHFADALHALTNGMLLREGADGAVDHPARTRLPETEPIIVTHAYLVESALIVFSHSGTALTSFDEISKLTGYPVAMLERRYGTIGALVAEVWDDRVLPDLRLAASVAATPYKRLCDALDTLSTLTHSAFWLSSAYLRVLHTQQERSALSTFAEPDHTADVFVEILRDGQAAVKANTRGGIRVPEGEVEATARALVWAVLSSTVSAGPPSEANPSSDAAWAPAVRLMLQSLRA